MTNAPPLQLPLDLPVRTALGRDSFAVSAANADAVALIEGWTSWPAGKLVLSGPEGAGKTHLTHVWAGLTGASVLPAAELANIGPALLRDMPRETRLAVEDVPGIAGVPEAEEALFHLHNHITSNGGALLLTGVGTPSQWPIALPDLASRLQGATVVRLAPPDDALLAHLLVKLFADRQIVPPPAMIAWLVPRMERSFAEAQRIVQEIDRRALAESRPIGQKLAAAVLTDQPGLDFDA